MIHLVHVRGVDLKKTVIVPEDWRWLKKLRVVSNFQYLVLSTLQLQLWLRVISAPRAAPTTEISYIMSRLVLEFYFDGVVFKSLTSVIIDRRKSITNIFPMELAFSQRSETLRDAPRVCALIDRTSELKNRPWKSPKREFVHQTPKIVHSDVF